MQIKSKQWRKTSEKLTKNKNNAVIAEATVVAKATDKEKQSASFIGLEKEQFINRDYIKEYCNDN